MKKIADNDQVWVRKYQDRWYLVRGEYTDLITNQQMQVLYSRKNKPDLNIPVNVDLMKKISYKEYTELYK